MSEKLKSILNTLSNSKDLNRLEEESAFEIIMSGEAHEAQIGAFLMGLRIKGETIDEITGAVSIMRSKVTKVSAPDNAIDIVGTGGDKSGTFNISTENLVESLFLFLNALTSFTIFFDCFCLLALSPNVCFFAIINPLTIN